jgi:hypothetical protein
MSASRSSEGPGYQVFIAASEQDQWATDAVRRALTGAGISCLSASDNLLIVKATIPACQLTVFILSPRSLGSGELLKEAMFADSLGIPIIALLIDNAELPAEYDRLLQHHGLRLPASGNLEFHLPVLVNVVRSCLPQEKGEIGVPPKEILHESVAQGVTTDYPVPIAFPYRRFCERADPRWQLERLFHSAESTVRYLATLGLANLFAGLALEEDETAGLPPHPAFDVLRYSKGSITFGQWAELLRETVSALSGRPHPFVPDLIACCDPHRGAFWDLISRLVRKRNDAIHGGVKLLPHDKSSALLRDLTPLLDELLQRIQFVRDYPLAFAAPPPWLGFHSCMGVHVTALTWEGPAASVHLQPDLLFVVAWRRALALSLAPADATHQFADPPPQPVRVRPSRATGRLLDEDRLRRHGRRRGVSRPVTPRAGR